MLDGRFAFSAALYGRPPAAWRYATTEGGCTVIAVNPP
jgi:hypothetical protein